MNKKTYFFLVALIMVFVFCGSSAVTAADPTNNTINGTITIKEYNAVKNLTNATVTVNNSGKVLGTATTDQNGYYSINFFSNQTKFNVTANFVGCNSTNQTVTISKGAGSDPNYYGTANIQLTPNNVWWTGTMGSSTKVYIKHYGGYYTAGQLQVTMDGVNFYYAYCIDIYTGIGPNDLLLVNGPLPGTRGDLNSSINWAKVNYILNHYDPSKNTTDDAKNIEGAAIQCAIWYFTSANYGLFPVNNASYTGYYQFMTYDNRYNSSLPSPYDGRTEKNYGTNRNPNYNMVEDRTWQIINAALAMQYPATIELSPETSNLENGGSLNLTGIVKDQNGNPLNNITVNFTTTSGTFNATSAVTDAFGRVKVSISGLSSSITSLVTASVTGSYGNLLYDNPLNPKQNLVAANLLPFTLSDTSYINCNPKANVTLSQTVNSPVNVGDTVTYIVTANNRGPNAATNIVISDVIPASLANVTVTPSVGTYNSSTGLWIIPTLNNGASATLTITGKATAVMAGLNTTNTATRIAQDQYNAESNTTSAKVYTKKANVVLSEVVNSPVNVGGLVTYVVTALNNGPDTVTNVLISDVLPAALAGFTVTPSVGTYNSGVWTIPSLANGASATLSIVGNATAAMAGFNTTNTATQTNQTEYSNLFTSANATAYTKKANVTVTNTATNSTLNVGNNGVFTVVVTNNGPDAATNIKLTDLIPGFTGTVTIGSYDNTTGIWTIPSLANGTSATLTLSGMITAAMAGTNITSHVTENQTEYPFNTTAPDAKTYIKKANVVLSEVVNSPVNVGGLVTYVVTALNNGPDTVTNIVISDVLPAALSGFTVTPSVGTYNSGVWTIPSLVNGASVTLSIVGNATAVMAGFNTTNIATQTGQTEFSDLYTSANATAYTKMADTKLSQTVTTPVNVGGTVTYVVTITNTGPDTATNFIIQDNVPAGLANYTVTPSVGTYINGNWTIFSLANGESVTLTITGIATDVMAGKNTTNTATKITETEYDPTTIGESTEADAYTKEANVVLSQVGGYNKNNVTFIVTALNNGPDNATEVNIKDLIPNGLSGVIVTPSVGTYDIGTGIWYIPVLVNGTSATLNISGTGVAQSTINNTANKMSQAEYDPFTPDITFKGVYIPSVDISIRNNPWYYDELAGDYQWWYQCGNTPVFYVMVSNSAKYNDATGVVMTYNIGTGYDYRGFDTQGIGTVTYDNLTRTLTWNIGYMPKNSTVLLKVFTGCLVSGNKTASLTNIAKITKVDQFEASTFNNNASCALDILPSADVGVKQSYVVNGSYVTYNITVTNSGPNNATGVQITDKLPVLLSDISYKISNDGGSSWVDSDVAYNVTTGVWNIGNFSVNDLSKILMITAKLPSNGTVINNATKTAQGEHDWNFNDNSQQTIINISGAYSSTVDVSIVRHVPWYYDSVANNYQYWYQCGNTPVFYVVVSNSAKYNDATGVVMTYNIGTGYDYRGFDTQGIGTVTYDNLTRTLTWNIGYMPKNSTVLLKVFTGCLVSGNKTASLTNIANITQVGINQTDVKFANNNASCALDILPSADVGVKQSYVVNGSYVTYNITVTNSGPNNATGVQITDKLPVLLSDISYKISNDGGSSWVDSDVAYNVTTGVWNIGNFSVNDLSKILMITAKLPSNGTVINNATKTAQGEHDWNFNDNSQQTIINIRDN